MDRCRAIMSAADLRNGGERTRAAMDAMGEMTLSRVRVKNIARPRDDSIWTAIILGVA